MNFNKNQQVVCIKGASEFPKIPNIVNPPLYKGKIYNIYNIFVCPCCSSVLLDVGIQAVTPTLVCDKRSCRHVFSSNGIWWLSTSCFAILQYGKSAIAELVASHREVAEKSDIPVAVPILN